MSDIDNLRSPYSLPMSPMMRPKCAMEESAGFPPDHLEPSPMRPGISESAKVTRKLASNDSILGAAAFHKAEADRLKIDNKSLSEQLTAARAEALLWKELHVCEMTRGDHDDTEHYKAGEMARAKAEARHWSAFQGEAGEATAWRKAIE
jgi:hypothetical protein